MPDSPKVEKLSLLEAKIGSAVQRIGELAERCRVLSEQNEQMEGEMAQLKNSNSELSQQIVELKAARDAQPKRSVSDRQILSRIDRMLEKFGELQI